MTLSRRQPSDPTFKKRVIIIAGGYGSGKSEVAVNLARHLAVSQSLKVIIADLDIVNPYFRSREAAAKLADLGVISINPAGDKFHADLPIVLPEVRGAMEREDGIVIVDVGGDDAGARVLGSLEDALPEDGYELLLVLNANRPFSADVESCEKMMNKIAGSSRLSFTGIVSNTHMLETTTPETVMDGLDLARQLSRRTNLPIVFLSGIDEVLGHLDMSRIDVPVLMLDRQLLKPWERSKSS